jgi:amylosucrase
MYTTDLHRQVNEHIQHCGIDIGGADNLFYVRFLTNATAISHLFGELYGARPDKDLFFSRLLDCVTDAYRNRPVLLRQLDTRKDKKGDWHLSNEIAGMSLYVDRFCGNLETLETRLDYFGQLGVNLLHLMPLMKSPAEASDGGYAVSDFREIDVRFGSMRTLEKLRESMNRRGMYLMLDIVLNHTSDQHEWALKAKAGEKEYQEYFNMYPDREMPDRFDEAMPEIFPESSPGNFTFSEACNRWVMTVFHDYQWDLNYTNPAVFLEMLDTIFFYANIGVDILRIDAPAFIWKRPGTSCQNLPEAHTLLCLIKLCVQTATPGMALLGEAIVAPREIMRYFGTGLFTGRECDFAYNATHMALQWDALATGDVRVMRAAQPLLLQKPYGSSWITYTRCHDDIGLGYEDEMIQQAGYTPYDHRRFLKNYYSGIAPGSPAKGALFSVNPKTQDARISGSLASLCGLEKGMEEQEADDIDLAIRKILLMQAHSFFLGGIPMLYYGDEAGYTNDYSYLRDSAKNYDNRWMHRPVIDWERQKKVSEKGSIEYRIFSGTRSLLELRRKISVVADLKNTRWIDCQTSQVAGYCRSGATGSLCCFFNFSDTNAAVSWSVLAQVLDEVPAHCFEHLSGREFTEAALQGVLRLEPYQFLLLDTAH